MNTFTAMPSLMSALLLKAPKTGGVSRAWLGRVGESVWNALCASGEFRARQHMLNFADGCEALQPSLAAELRAASARVGVR